MKIRGLIEKGVGKGAFFTSLDWVVEQFEKGLGWKPYPGTLNVRVAEEDIPRLKDFFSQKDLELVPDDPAFCSAGLKSVRVNGIPAAVVFPSEDVRIHANDIIEVIAGCHIKDTLRLADGDQVTISSYAADSGEEVPTMSDGPGGFSCFEDLNEFIDSLAQGNDLTYISEEVSPRFEMGGVLRLLGEREGPAPLFTNVAEFPGKAVVGNLMAHRRRVAKAFGVPEADLKRVYLERREQRVPPVVVKEAPVKEVRWQENKVNLSEMLPALTHHEEDTSPYFTCAVTFARDPGMDRQSMGLHRVQILSERQMAVCFANPPLANFLRTARELKRPLQVAVAIGVDPLILVASVTGCPEGTDKIEIAGGFRQKPVKMVKCETVDVLVPAFAQFVIEGTIDPDEVTHEGTFGDSSGTYVEALSPVIRVTGLNHREKPLYQALQPWSREDDTLFNLCLGSDLLATIRKRYPFVTDLHLIRGTVGGHVIISVKDAPRPMIRSAIAALLSNDPHVKMAIAVDEDIDIRNNRELQWAMATRFQADRDLFIIPGVHGSTIDPSTSPDGASTKLGIDATYPKQEAGRFKKIRIPEESWNRAMMIVKKLGSFQKETAVF